MRDPSTPRRGGKGLRGQHVHNYRCEDVMEYAVDVFAWKKSLEMFYLPGDWTRYYIILLGYFFLSPIPGFRLISLSICARPC